MSIAHRTGPHPPSPGRPAAWANAPREWLAPGVRLDDFEIVRTIGSGGFGAVYLARDRSLDREVAIKEFLPMQLAFRAAGLRVAVRSPDLEATYCAGLRSFINEAKILARINHPAVVRVHRFWEGNGTAYMVMPYVRGPRLRDLRRSMAVAPTEAWLRGVIAPLLDALGALHAQGIYHRDIAPDNILLPHPQAPLLLDFGAARRVIGDRTQALTAVLKPSYAPIEQYAETSTLRQGPWTDLYALGAVVVYLLEAMPPPPSTVRVLHDELPALLRSLASGLSPSFVDALQWALAVRPQDRPQSAQELRSALDGGMTPPRPRMAVVIGGDFGRVREETPQSSEDEESAQADASDSCDGGDAVAHEVDGSPVSGMGCAFGLHEEDPVFTQPERATWDTTLRIDMPMFAQGETTQAASLTAPDSSHSTATLFDGDSGDSPEAGPQTDFAQRSRRSARMVLAAAAAVFVCFSGWLGSMLRGVPAEMDASIWRELAHAAPSTDVAPMPAPTPAPMPEVLSAAAPAVAQGAVSAKLVPSLGGVAPIATIAPMEEAPRARATSGRGRWSSSRQGMVTHARIVRLAQAGPREACSDHGFFTIGFCVNRKCEEPRFRRHPQCVALQREREDRLSLLDHS